MSDLPSLIFAGDLDAARSQARALIREVLENDTVDAVPSVDRRLVILDFDGAVVFSMPFADALH